MHEVYARARRHAGACVTLLVVGRAPAGRLLCLVAAGDETAGEERGGGRLCARLVPLSGARGWVWCGWGVSLKRTVRVNGRRLQSETCVACSAAAERASERGKRRRRRRSSDPGSAQISPAQVMTLTSHLPSPRRGGGGRRTDRACRRLPLQERGSHLRPPMVAAPANSRDERAPFVAFVVAEARTRRGPLVLLFQRGAPDTLIILHCYCYSRAARAIAAAYQQPEAKRAQRNPPSPAKAH